MSQHEVVLLLGSNLGNREKKIEQAMHELRANGCQIIKKTDFLISKPVEFASSNNFCNIAVIIETTFSPIKLLNMIKKIERKMGRKVDSAVYGHYTDRIIDIDIVTYQHLFFESKKLKIPHQKHILEREFSKILINSLEKQTKT